MSDGKDSLPNVQLAFVDVDQQTNMPAMRSINRLVIEDLRAQGLDIQASYNAERGGGLYELILKSSENIYANIGLLTLLFSIAKSIVDILEKRLGSDKVSDALQPKNEPQITINIDNRSLMVNALILKDIPKLVASVKAADPAIEEALLKKPQIRIQSSIAKSQKPIE